VQSYRNTASYALFALLCSSAMPLATARSEQPAAPASFANPAAAEEQLEGGERGTLHLTLGDEKICSFVPYVANRNWERCFAEAIPETPALSGASNEADIPQKNDAPFPYVIGTYYHPIRGRLQVAPHEGSVRASWTFSVTEETDFAALVVEAEFQLPQLSGGMWSADAASGTFPAIFGGAHLFVETASSLTLTFPDQRLLKFTFAKPTAITVQDNRQWGAASFSIRFGAPGNKIAAGETYTLDADITTSNGLSYCRELPNFMKPVEIHVDDQWIPLKDELDIVPDSALDLTSMGFTDGPCGSKGRIIVTPDGHFACEDEPTKTKRFYGVNLCFDSNYMPKNECDHLLDRLVRLGYNSVRIHHYELYLTRVKEDAGFDWDPVKVDQLDYLMAGCAKRGIWMTTDLFVSRPISGKQIGRDQEDKVEMNRYKILIPVSEPAYQDWQTFTRKFLDRVNPYTNKRVADEPALAWISLVNEGPITGYWGSVCQIPEWKVAWNNWLAARYPDRGTLVAAIPDLADGEDAIRGTVAIPDFLSSSNPRGRIAQVFVGDMEKTTYERMHTFLREKIKCQALLTNMNNSGPDVLPLIETRQAYDYVDEHFYVDHPTFLEKPWSLPSFCANANPIRSGASACASIASVRLFNKPFTVSEYNYAGPGRYRGVGGILTGALAAIQDWDALWRFEYSWSRTVLFNPNPMNYFDTVCDPLNQAADRLAAILFLRRDLTPAPTPLAMVVSHKSLENPTDKMGLSAMQAALWTTGIGCIVVDDTTTISRQYVPVPIEFGNDSDAIFAALKAIKPFVPPPSDELISTQTGQVSMRPQDGTLTIDTPMSAGGYVEPSKTIDASGVKVIESTTGAVVFINSLDANPIKMSKRLLVSHLTDLQNNGARFGEAARQTLLSSGRLPHLVRSGSATVQITLENPETYTVWGLSVGGRRVEKIPSRVSSGQLVLTVNVNGCEGARIFYEITAENAKTAVSSAENQLTLP